MSEEVLFPRKLASLFLFFDFLIPFYVGSGSKSDSGTGTVMYSGSGSDSAKAKSYGSCCSGSGSSTYYFSNMFSP
jgi:hypothetical protein